MQVMDKGADTGKVMGIESCWCLWFQCEGGGFVGDERELPQFGPMLFLPSIEKGGAALSKDSDGGFGENNLAVVVAELAYS